MGSIVSALTGGGSGAGWEAKQANLLNPATVDQANEQYGNVNTGLQQQMDFLKAIQAQNGLGNQSSVFNQMQNVASGQGPNPAQAMLANATGANVANQAALMAGQRGSGANAGMMARQAAQQGANIQQNAAGQGAALQAQQSLGALNQMGSLANQQAAQQAAATGAYNQFAQGAQQNILNAIQGQNQAAVSNMAQANQANAAMQGQIEGQQSNLLGGLTGAAGAVLGGMTGINSLGALGSAVGGMFGSGDTSRGVGTSRASPQAFADGGPVADGPKSMVGRHFASMMAQGGAVPALVSPGEKYLPPQAVEAVKQGASPLKEGMTIPGKPKVGGAKNSYANDTVPAILEEGGIVLPRSVTQAKDPAKKAAEFVAAVLKKQALKGK